MKVALIDPPSISKGFNLGLGILAARLKKQGCDVKVIDLNNRRGNYAERIKSILNYGMIGISIKSFTLKSAYRIIKEIDRKDIFCGGPHVILDGVKLLNEIPEIEIGFVSEAEDSLIEVLESKTKGYSLNNIEGIVYRKNTHPGGIYVSSPRPFNNDIDTFPFPDYSTFDSVKKGIYNYPILTSRGCPYSCVYCCVGKISGKKIRYRSIENVLQELNVAQRRFLSKKFSILDDNFTFDITRAKKFCKALKKSNLDLTWGCPNGVRADRIDEELVSLMKDSGCEQATIGIENLDEKIFQSIKKGESKETIIKTIGLFKKYRIKIDGFFIIGLPGDTFIKAKHSVIEARRLGLNHIGWNMFVPYPHTEAWEWARKNANILSDWKDGFHFGPNVSPTFETNEFSKKEMVCAYRLANIKCKNYSIFINNEVPLLVNCINLLIFILRYDAIGLFSHIKYIFSNLVRFKKYLG
jgi:radical SAM superfamily enzyme YgiQ (UPF0313 family)